MLFRYKNTMSHAGDSEQFLKHLWAFGCVCSLIVPYCCPSRGQAQHPGLDAARAASIPVCAGLTKASRVALQPDETIRLEFEPS